MYGEGVLGVEQGKTDENGLTTGAGVGGLCSGRGHDWWC